VLVPPWADTADVVSATATVQRADGTVEQVEAVERDGRWVADARLAAGDTAFVDAGGAQDSYGEVNGTASEAVTRP
jgi:hypothetical protein